MPKPRITSGTSIVMAVALFAALTIVVSLLFLFKDYLQGTYERMPERIAAGLRPEMLRSRNEIPRFELIEEFASRAKQDFPDLTNLLITKIRPDSLECTIYPLFVSDGVPEDYPSVKIEQDGIVLGYLYYRLDTGSRILIENVINVLIPMLILAAFALAWHVWRQERILATTRIQLVEKNSELGQLERLSLAGQLAANLLHDLKKPVLHIRDELRHSQQNLDPKELNEQVELFFQMLRETNLEKLASSSDEREEFLDIEEILRASVNLVKYERDQIAIHFEIEPNLPLIKSYKYRLIQVFSNLLLNAFQALAGRGDVWIRAGCKEIEAGGGGESNTCTQLSIEIEDSGPGIAPEDLPRVFQPFFSASGRAESSGLGLYISKSIIEDLGGKVEISSQQGKGTLLLVTLPADEDD